MAEQAARSVADEPVPLVNARSSAGPPAPGIAARGASRRLDGASRLARRGARGGSRRGRARASRLETPAAARPRASRRRPPAATGGGLDAAEARTALRAVAGDREGLKDVVLRYARRTLDFVAAFAVVRGAAMGWDAQGDGAEEISIQQVAFPLDVPSVFRTATLAHSCYAGPVPGDVQTREVLALARALTALGLRLSGGGPRPTGGRPLR